MDGFDSKLYLIAQPFIQDGCHY